MSVERMFTAGRAGTRHAGLLVALLSCAPRQPAQPATPPRDPAAERWDGALLFSSREIELVWVGPVLRGFLPESSGGVRGAVSERCRLLAGGIPYQGGPMNRYLRGFALATGWFAGRWSLDDSGHATACTDAFGATFSLPTAEQARGVIEHLVPPQQSTITWGRDEADRMVILRLVREAGRSRVERVQRASAPIYCVAAASQLPALEPSDEETRSCARRARAEAELIDPEIIEHFLDEVEIEKTLTERPLRRKLQY
jgi:hypothetical protein